MKGNKHYPKSYKEKEISTPYESGRRELSTRNKDNISDTRNTHNTDDENTEYTHKSAIEWAFWESAYDAEQDIYRTIDYNLWNTEDVSPALVEALEYYKQEEEKTSRKKEKERKNVKKKEKIIEEITEDDMIEDSTIEETPHNSLNNEEISLQETEEIYNDEGLYNDNSNIYFWWNWVEWEIMVTKGTAKKRRSKKPNRLSTKEWDQYQKNMKNPEKRKQYYEELKEYNKKLKVFKKNLNKHNKHIEERGHDEPTPREHMLKEPKDKPYFFIKKTMKNTNRKETYKAKKSSNRKKTHEVLKDKKEEYNNKAA